LSVYHSRIPAPGGLRACKIPFQMLRVRKKAAFLLDVSLIPLPAYATVQKSEKFSF
jgi:hypothetical protein